MFIAKGEQEKGFTLIEAMITMGVVTVIGLGMMSLMQNTMKGQQTATTYSDFSTLDSAIQVLFNGNSSACGSALQSSPGVPVSFPSPVPSTLSSPIPIPIVATNNVTLLNSATPVNGWRYSLAITNILENLAPTYMVQIQLTGQKTASAQTLGSPVRTGSTHTVFMSTGSCPSGHGQCITQCGTSNTSQSQSQGTFNAVVGFSAPMPSGMPTNGPAPTPTPWMTTWTSPPSATAALVETWGAGGGAGFFSCFKTSIQIFDDADSGTRSRAHSTCDTTVSPHASTGQGGGGGAYSAAYVMLQPSTKYYVYVGVGGLGDNINKTPGWPGGDSYFALSKTSSPTNSPPLVWAGGGQGGGNGNSTAIAPNGGVPGTGQIQIPGEPGIYDIGTGYYNGMAANGGSSPYGGSGGEGSSRGGKTGCSAGNFPGGGGGAAAVWGQGPSNKYTPMCNGASGYVRITYSVPPNYSCPPGQSLEVNSSGQMVCNQITYVTASYETNPSCTSGIVTYCAASNGLTCNPASGSSPTSCQWVTATNNGPEPTPDPTSSDGPASGTCTATCVLSTPATQIPLPGASPE